ncbi:MAG: metal-dependent hydrolase [Acidobacteriota bacterium]|nr:metal-dependent hydrolase [Acidobacteriota bacterium]
MDPLTHLLTGACIARSGLNRKSALATTVVVLAAEAPDLDILAYLGGPVAGFEHHRGITHTFLGVPLVAAAVVGFVWLLYRWRIKRGWQPKIPVRWRLLFGFACLAALSHILLDFTNQYGVRPFAPFSYRWYSWDIIAIVEPVLLVILAGGLIVPLLFRLINEEVGARSQGPHGRAGAIVALVLMCGLWWFRDLHHRRALSALAAQSYLGADPERVSAYPYNIDPFTWYGVAEIPTAFAQMRVDSSSGEVDRERRMRVRYKPEEPPVVLAAKRSAMGRVYLDWAAYPYLEVEKLPPPKGGYLVHFNDLRYFYPDSTANLTANVELDDQLRVRRQGMGRWMQPAD